MKHLRDSNYIISKKAKACVFMLFLPCLFIWDLAAQPDGGTAGNPVFEVTLRSPVKTINKGYGHYLFDFGKDAFGTVVLEIRTDKPDTLVIQLGEKLNSTGSIDPDPGGSIRYQRVLLPVTPAVSTYTINLPADKRNTSPPAVPLPETFGVIMPFRYCEIRNITVPSSSFNIKQKVFNYWFDDSASNFTSSDTILNQVWELCKYSMKATSFCGVYIDGDRERIPYEADAYINQLSHYSVDDEYSVARRTNEYFITHPTWPTEWQLYNVLLFYNDYMYTGDIRSIERNYDALKVKTLSGLARDDGLISSASKELTGEFMLRLGFADSTQRIRDIVDWPPAQKDTGWKLATEEGERDGYEMVPVNTVVNALFYENLRLMSEIAGWLGNKEDSAWFSRKKERVYESINSLLFDTSRGIYVDGEGSVHSSLHANMFPLAFGLVPEEHIGTVVEFIKSRGMACSVYGSQILLDGLYMAGEEDYALDLLTSTSDRSWWNMIRSGSTITMEAWDMKYKPNSDWNHAWGAAPANIIVRRLWGIRPLEPGFRKAIIKPQPGKLTYSMISVPTIPGTINAIYKAINKDMCIYGFEIPPGMKAEFIVEEHEQVLVNNKQVLLTDRKIELEPGHTDIEIRK